MSWGIWLRIIKNGLSSRWYRMRLSNTSLVFARDVFKSGFSSVIHTEDLVLQFSWYRETKKYVYRHHLFIVRTAILTLKEAGGCSVGVHRLKFTNSSHMRAHILFLLIIDEARDNIIVSFFCVKLNSRRCHGSYRIVQVNLTLSNQFRNLNHGKLCRSPLPFSLNSGTSKQLNRSFSHTTDHNELHQGYRS